MIPQSLLQAIAPVTVVCGHYGAGKTNFSVNLACDLADAGRRVTLIDLDIVNPYFRATEQRSLLEDRGVKLVAPVFAERGTSLDVPSLTGAIIPAIDAASDDGLVIIDAGGDDVGATALGRFSERIAANGHSVLYVANRFRNLVQDPQDALVNMAEIQAASRLDITAIVDNAHLKHLTDIDTLNKGYEYACELAELTALPIACVTMPSALYADKDQLDAVLFDKSIAYPIRMHVRNPWE